jgi:glutamine synthetase
VPHNEAVASSKIVGTASTVRVLFSDLHGLARGKDVPVRAFDRVAEQGIGFCSAVIGTDLRHTPVVGREDGYPDMRAVPDMSTLAPVPWEPGVSAVIADLMRVGAEQPEPTDPRGALRCAVKELEELGYSPNVGPELEFYLCRSDGGDPPRFSRHLDRPSMIYTVGPQADPDGFVRRLTEMLSEFGLEAFAVSHEFGSGQYEINVREAAALTAADRAFSRRSTRPRSSNWESDSPSPCCSTPPWSGRCCSRPP